VGFFRGFVSDAGYWRASALTPVSKLLFEVVEVRFNKGLTAIGLKESLDLSGAISFLTQTRHLLFEGLATRRAVAGLDALE